MRIDSMDAALKPTVSINKSEKKIDIEADFEKRPEISSNQITMAQDQTVTEDKVSISFVDKAINKANETMHYQGRSMRFEIHEKTNDIMVKIIDTETKEIIREIPSEKILDMFANMLEMAGLLVDERR